MPVLEQEQSAVALIDQITAAVRDQNATQVGALVDERFAALLGQIAPVLRQNVGTVGDEQVGRLKRTANAVVAAVAKLAQVIQCKRADEPLNMERLMMVIACPAFFRWYVIGARYFANVRATSSGSTGDVPREYHGDLHIGHCYSRREADNAIRDLLATIGTLEAAAA